jgi:puromycin-sensitive aminopeptidase
VVDPTPAPETSASPADAENPYRLPREVVPRRYELTLAPDLGAASFNGAVAAAVDVVGPTDTVVLNAAELEIDEAWVEVDGRRIGATVTLDEETERATLALPETLPAGTATVGLRFRGTLNDKLRGFYRSTFTDEGGTERVLACTQMESTDARRAFPCWDEPDFKAVFAVTLVVADGLLAISNGAEVSRSRTDDGRVAVRFADTIPMSSYLVAFVVGPLEVTDPVDVDGTPLRVVHPLGKGGLTRFATEVGAFCLRYFSEWFAIDYPGDKLDLVAIPDFAFGAMENLGCITFRERLLLIDPNTSTQAERQAVVDVIAHEIAHMWFGDLVTMKWWNGIWLNEAFATFMEMKATDAFRPDWQRWVDFGLSRSVAFDTDTLATTRPIEFPVVSPADADGMFDVLTYEKGASVVRMLEQYLGEDGFRAGLRRYMARHQLGNTETTDLWDALEEETGEPVRRIADTWIFQGGYPGVAVELVDGAGSDGASVLRLSQHRFMFSPADHGERWAVPVVIGARTNGDTSVHKVLLDEDVSELSLSVAPEWVNANLGANGFYRVAYSDDLRSRLVARRADLSPLERYVLVDDTLAGVLAGTVEAAAFLDLAEAFTDETDLSVWERLVGGLVTLDRVLDDGPARDAYAARVRALLAPARADLGDAVRPDDDDRTKTLRGLLTGSAATLGDDPDALSLCRDRLDAYLDSPSSVDPSLAASALSASATHGDVALHDRLLDAFRSAKNPQDRERLLFSLARFRDPAALQRTLDVALAGEVRTQDAPYLLREAIANRDNAATAWGFVTANWDDLLSRFPHNSLSRMISGIRTIRDPDLAAEVSSFLATHPLPTGEMQVRQHLERMHVTVALAQRESPRLTTALT